MHCFIFYFVSDKVKDTGYMERSKMIDFGTTDGFRNYTSYDCTFGGECFYFQSI